MFFINVNGIILNYKIVADKNISENAQHMIILHGGPGVSDHSLYFDFWSQFSNQVKVIFFDMRGHGESEKGNKEDWNLAQWGRDVFDLCNA